MAGNGGETVGRSLGMRLLGRFVLSVGGFIFIAVPLETYVKAFLGAFDNGSLLGALLSHFFVQAASCFYSVTLLVDTMVVTSSPHLRGTPISQPGFRYAVFSVITISLLSYVGVTSAVSRGHFDAANAPTEATWVFIYWVLSALLVFSIVFSAAVHAYEYYHSLSL